MPAASIKDAFALAALPEKNKYVSVNLPEKMGNSADIAFGGAVLSMSVNAAVSVVPPQFRLYSAHGFYLGPTLANDKLMFQIIPIRNTKTFQTLRVEARQVQKGQERTTFYITLDFQVIETPVLQYNLPTRLRYPPPNECLDILEHNAKLVEQGKLPKQLVKPFEIGFSLFRRFFEQRPCPNGLSAQNLLGMHKKAKTDQDHLPMHEKVSAYWFRSRVSLTQAEGYAALAFVMDAALAFLPATFRNTFLDDYGAISSLDCTMRFHCADFDCNDWLLHEQVTEGADLARTFSTGRIFRQDGTLVASMHQMSIMREKPKRSVQKTAPKTTDAKL